MSGELIIHEKTEEIAKREKIALIKRMYCKDASDDEMEIFSGQCNRTGLRVENKQIYFMKRAGVMTTMVSIDGLRLIAQRTGEYDGQSSPFWCGEDGAWTDVWLAEKNPSACKVAVFRKNCSQPFFGVAHFREYVGDTKNSYSLWKKMPALMIAKCAEALALRKAFPLEMSGLYSAEELGNDDRDFGNKEYKRNKEDKRKEEHCPNLVNLSFLDTTVSYEDGRTFKKSGQMTWRQLAQNDDLPGGGSGRSYLHQLSSWKEQSWVSVRAKIALEEVENKKKEEGNE